jgi:hypothetical protein
MGLPAVIELFYNIKKVSDRSLLPRVILKLAVNMIAFPFICGNSFVIVGSAREGF